MALHWSLKTLMKWICHASFPPFLQAAPFMQENSSLFFPVFVCLWGLETDVAAGNKPLRPKSALSVLSRVSQLLISKVPLLLSSLLWHCTPFTHLWHSHFFVLTQVSEMVVQENPSGEKSSIYWHVQSAAPASNIWQVLLCFVLGSPPSWSW